MSAYYNEIDPFAGQWLRNLIAAGHIAPGDVDERSIEDVQPGDLVGYTQCHFFAGIGVWSHALRGAGWPDDRPVWTGSCPCQSFSAAGSGRGFDDRRHLWPHFFRLIRKQRPSTVFGEQVASKDGLAWLDFVCADMEGEGYAIAPVDLCAAGFGAPHIRQRLYFVAHAERGAAERHGRELENAASSVQGAARQQRIRADLRDGRESSELADSDGGYAGPEGLQRSRQHGLLAQGRGLGLMGDAEQSGLAQQRRQRGVPCGQDAADPRQAIKRAGASIGGFWHDAEWIACSDGKTRATGPGVFPLAHGTTERMGRLRGYGNAIVAPVAQGFIEAFMECKGDEPCAPQI